MMAPVPSPLGSERQTFECMYGAFRAQARRYLRCEQNAYSLSPTVLVHEAWIALARSRGRQIGREHYARLVQRAMKNLLVDHARQKRAVIHGGALQRVEWDEATAAAATPGDHTSAMTVAGAIEALARKSPRLATLVELRYLDGFTESETARLMGVSTRTVRRYWDVARLRLQETLQASTEPLRRCA